MRYTSKADVDNSEPGACDACEKARPVGVTLQWTWIWSDASQRALCFCPECSAKLPPASSDGQVS